MDIDLVVVRNFALALAIGALVGIEREKHKTQTPGISFGGVRTFILLAQVGAVSAWLSLHIQSPWIFAVALLTVGAFVLTAYRLENQGELRSLGLASEISALTVFLLGGAVMYGYAELAVPLAILTSAVLTFKQPLHGLVAKLASDDWVAGVKLLIATFIVLPLLPNHPIDPWQAINPYKLWLLVILISALSLVGYIAMRVLGAVKGTLVAGLTGGLVSSTAVSLSFARLSQTMTGQHASGISYALAAGILWAWLVMCFRVLLMAGLLYLPMLQALWPTVAVMAVLTLGFALFYSKRGHSGVDTSTSEPLANPFSLWAAVQFGLVFAVVLLVVSLTEHYAPAQGLYLVSTLAGVADVDAITLSMTELAQQDKVPLAAQALMLALMSNTVVKTALVWSLASTELKQRMLPAATVIFLGSLSAWFLV